MTARVDLYDLELLAKFFDSIGGEETRDDIRAAIAELRDLRARMERAPVSVVLRSSTLVGYSADAPSSLLWERVRLVVCDEP